MPGRAAVLFGLSGVAVVQPLLDLFGRNPEFFVSGRFGGVEIGLFALAVALVPPIAALVLTELTRRVHVGLGIVVLLLVAGAFGAVLGAAVVRRAAGGGLLVPLVAAGLGALIAMALVLVTPGRMLLQYLAAANALFVASFLLVSPVSSLVLAGSVRDRGRVEVPSVPGPVVMVILDEFPLSELLDASGAINADRFPNFARLAERTTWFRNASTRHTVTHVAVPELLTGTTIDEPHLPTYRDLPRNLFTLLGSRLPVERYELLTDLCPADICDPPPQEPLTQAFRDAAVVFGHRVLPAPLRSDLPAIDHSWGGFGNEVGDGDDATTTSTVTEPDVAGSPSDPMARWQQRDQRERLATGQVAILRERSDAIEAEPALHMIHVALPHYPWILTPWGTRVFDIPERVEDPADPAYDWSSQLVYQLASMQAGAADVAIGELIDHLDDIGAWDDTTLVVTSDHGTSLLPPDFGRKLTRRNQQELLRVPLFIKAAGQTEGVRRDEPAQSIDVLPSLADLLGVTTSWHFDGHSLFDGSTPTVEPLVGRSFAPEMDVVRRHLADVPGTDWIGLAAVGDHADLVGQPLADLELGADSALQWTPDHEADFASLPNSGGGSPQLLTGLVVPTGTDAPPQLVASVNGRIAGVIGGYVHADGGFRFTSYLAPFLVTGANEIRAFEVERTPGGVVLHEVR